jgi:hypothetical protein
LKVQPLKKIRFTLVYIHLWHWIPITLKQLLGVILSEPTHGFNN